MAEHTCKYCQHKWNHAIGGMCPSCFRFQVQVVEHKSDCELPMLFNYPDKPYPLVGLYPKQKEARDLALVDLRKQNFSILRIGQRGGKTFLAAEIARLLEKKLVYIFDSSEKSMSYDFPIANYFCGTEIPEQFLTGNINVQNAIIVINEAFWLKDSFELFENLRFNAPEVPILVIGANGPEQETGWKDIPGHTYASWEINPKLHEQKMRKDFIDPKDPESEKLFERDFGRFGIVAT